RRPVAYRPLQCSGLSARVLSALSRLQGILSAVGARSLSQPDALTGVIAALPVEARTASRLKSQGWRVVAGGVGAERARAAANQLVAHGARRLLVWGTAGALRVDLQPGAVILADRVFDGHSLYYPVTASWHKCLRLALPA